MREKGLNPVDNVLSKPVNPSFLFNVIMEAFGREVPRDFKRRQKGQESVPNDLTPIRWARILLVEDNAINRQVARELLGKAHLVIEEAVDGETAVRMVKETPYDCILMDIQMPGMDGFETVQVIRAMDGMAQIPILAMTADTMQENRQRALDVGMNGHVSKPIQPMELFSTLLKWIAPGERPEPERAQGTDSPERADGIQGGPVAPDEEMPPIPGVNAAKALLGMDGSVTLFQSLLRTFLADHADDERRLRQVIAAGNRKEAQRLAHSLKGVSAALGMEAVTQVSWKLESAIKEDSDHLTDPLLVELGSALNPVVEALRQRLPDKRVLPARPEGQPPVGGDWLKERLDSLDVSIREYNIQALSQAEELVQCLEAGAARDLAVVLADLLDQFEFDKAAKSLEALRSEMGGNDGEDERHGRDAKDPGGG